MLCFFVFRRQLDYQDVLDNLKSKGISIRVASPKLVMEEVRFSHIWGFQGHYPFALFADRCGSLLPCVGVSLWILSPSSLPAFMCYSFCCLIVIYQVSFPLSVFLNVMVQVSGCRQRWFPLPGLPWFPPCLIFRIWPPPRTC